VNHCNLITATNYTTYLRAYNSDVYTYLLLIIKMIFITFINNIYVPISQIHIWADKKHNHVNITIQNIY